MNCFLEKMLCRSFFIFFFLLVLNILSQNIYFPYYHYETENGLVHLNVLSIQQDKNNVLNFVTQGGVYEFDGKLFVKNQEYSSLKNIRNIFFNDTSVFLVQRDKGVFYLSKKNIKPLFPQNPFKRPSDKIILTTQYCFNFTDQISVEFYDYKNKIYYNDSILLKDNTNQAFGVYQVNNKIIQIRRKGVYFIEGNKIFPLSTFINTPVYSLYHQKKQHLVYLGSSGKIIVTDDSLFKIQKIIPVEIHSPSKSNQFLFKMEKNISKILVDNLNRIWFSTQPDDNLYLMENQQIYDVFDIMNILPVLINDIYLDNFNNVWLATFNDGVYQIASTFWQSFRIKSFDKIFNVKAIEHNNPFLFFATNNGFFYSDTSHLMQLKEIISPDNFFNNEIYSLQKVSSNIFASNITAFEPQQIKLNSSTVYTLPFKYLSVKDNQYCFITDITNNVMLYDYRKNKVSDTVYKTIDYKLNIKHIFYWNNELFLSTNKGLIIINLSQKNTSVLFEDKEVQKVLLLDNQIYILFENKILNYQSNKIIFDAEPYHIVTITDIEKYNDKYLIASEEGLLLLDNKLQFINHFGRKNGLISNVINDVLILNNKIIVATDRGISYSRIENLFNTSFSLNTPNIRFIVADNDTLWHYLPSVQISKNHHDIFFHLVCPNYNPLTKTTFQYSLDNSEWINFDNSPLHISALSGGLHILKIRATTDGKYFTEPLVIQLNKEHLLHEKSWFWEFIIISSIALILLSIWIVRYFEKKKNAERLKNIQQMNLLKHQAMNAILSPHFIFNSLTGIQNYILNNEAEKASEYLSKFSRLIRMIIEKASQSNINIQDELKRLQFYLDLEKERFHDKFEYEITVDEKIDLENTHIPNMIIQPYLENAILHGILPKKEKGKVIMSFKLNEKNWLEIIIEDDGIGIIKGEERKPKHHKSIATQTIAEILTINTQLYNKHQSVEIIDKSTLNNNQTGTIVKILIEL